MSKKLTEKAINTLVRTIQDDITSGKLSGEDVWQYISDNTYLCGLSQEEEYDPTVAATLSAFLAGIKFSLECIRVDDDDLVDVEE